MTTSRRDFLKIVGTTTGGMLMVPKFLPAMPTSGLYRGYTTDRNVLVVIQLNGGNDGLNTFIPYESPQYYDFRKTIAIPKEQVLKAAAGGMGWHPALSGFAEIQQAGHMAVIQNVGYPNPNRSHFRSIEIWQTASSESEYLRTGWLGRYLDATCKPEESLGALNLDTIDNPSLIGEGSHALTMQDPQRFERLLKGLNGQKDVPFDENPNLDFVRKLMIGSFEGSDQIAQALEKSAASAPTYPRYKLAQNLSWMAKMIKGGLPTLVYYTGMGSFDTHSNQPGKHKALLTELSASVKAFYDDLVASNLLDQVTIMIFSEFGRRVKDNGSGTDHGAAAPLFVIGGKNSGKILGTNPDFDSLVQGDLKHQYDFRSVYASILQQKLGVDPVKAGIRQAMLSGIFS
ncbi:DUF1501 domain-containing protein [Salmonirosea aquatica]|uniref:DUF1501 domain-containing protein n=1 Tax=Salmonirosea aquatica TaxID=2654236 RepID=A0A7C9BKI9_9BACT|nr:DUF1501 domain-containing protein [Cytophagaceae bacterium SJW1-29]